MVTPSAHRVVRRILGKDAKKAKRMVIMVGPPAAGKGFILGEPEKWTKDDVAEGKAKEEDIGKIKPYKDEEGKEHATRYGYKLPQMLKNGDGEPLFTEDDIPDEPDQDESDNHLRAIQHDEARKHHAILTAAHKKGKSAFNKALDDLWYETKDGNKVSLGDTITFKDFPEEFDSQDKENDFFDKTNKDFYVSMRGWHDEYKEHNKVTGKPKESFKDAARHSFDEAVEKKLAGDPTHQSDLFIVDSAGEDIDTQDWKGQIESAKNNGYEVSVVFLHPEQADTELSNLARGKVQGKRMVDQQDISNWYEQNEKALKDIEEALPDNFMHFRKGPPGQPPGEAVAKREEAKELMNGLAGMSDKGDPSEKKKAKKVIQQTLYGSPYKFNTETSYGRVKAIKNKKPASPPPIYETVKRLNDDAAKRAEAPAEKSKGKSKDDDNDKAKKDKAVEETKGKGKDEDQTRMDMIRDIGDQMVPNPNPNSRKRYPQVKIRSLEWEHQKKYYDQWSAKAAAIRVAHRHIARLERKIMADEKSWLSDWMAKIAKDIENDLHVPDYKVSAESSRSPVLHVTVAGASEDTTTAKNAKTKIKKIMEAAIKDEMARPNEWGAKVNGYNKGEDMVFACEIIFP